MMCKKNNFVLKFLIIFMLIFSFQFDTNLDSNDARAADPACIINADGQIDSSSIMGGVNFCTTQPASMRMFPIAAWACATKPTVPTTAISADFSDCFQILAGDGVTAVNINNVGAPEAYTGGVATPPGSGIFNYIVLEAKPIFGIQGFITSDDATLIGGSIAGAGTADAAGEVCWTVAGSYTNTSKINMDCGEALGATYGMALLDMPCLDDDCTRVPAIDNEQDVNGVPGNDWQFSENNSGVSDAQKIDVVDSSGVSRETEYYVINFNSRILCSSTTCLDADNVRTAGVTTSMLMIQKLPTPVGSTNAVPKDFTVNFKLGTSQLIDTSTGFVATRIGPVAAEFILLYNQ